MNHALRIFNEIISHVFCSRYQRSDGDVDLLTKGDNNQVLVVTAPLLSLSLKHMFRLTIGVYMRPGSYS